MFQDMLDIKLEVEEEVAMLLTLGTLLFDQKNISYIKSQSRKSINSSFTDFLYLLRRITLSNFSHS